jgi:hypothetical protein
VKLKVSRIAVGSAVTLSLVGGSLLAAPDVAAQCIAGYDDKGEAIVAPAAVMITGGTVTNETVIDISANAGTSISDASGGNNNLAVTSGGNGGDGGVDTASSGNGGVATSAADGGAVSIQDINSGGNVGNAISVGDTTCAPYTPPARLLRSRRRRLFRLRFRRAVPLLRSWLRFRTRVLVSGMSRRSSR